MIVGLRHFFYCFIFQVGQTDLSDSDDGDCDGVEVKNRQQCLGVVAHGSHRRWPLSLHRITQRKNPSSTRMVSRCVRADRWTSERIIRLIKFSGSVAIERPSRKGHV